MTSLKDYAYTTAAASTSAPTRTVTGTYNNAWKGQLTSWDGETITYNTCGCMTQKGSTTYTWSPGNQLLGVNNGQTISYMYDYTGSSAYMKKPVICTLRA